MINLPLLTSVASLLLATIPHVSAQENSSTSVNINRWRLGLAPTDAYRQKMLQFMIGEANQFARDLKLAEHLPIKRGDVVAAFVVPPAAYINRSRLGTISTTNYEYYLTAGKTVSGLDQKNLVDTFYRAKSKYLWPIDQMDTNAACRVATQILIDAKINARELNQDCNVSITSAMPEGANGKHFVPIYWITWQKSDTNVALIEVLLPTKTIRQLHCYDPKYILRKPIETPNLAELLKRSVKTNSIHGSERNK